MFRLLLIICFILSQWEVALGFPGIGQTYGGAAGGGGGSAPTIDGTAVGADSNNTTGVCPALTTSGANETIYIAALSGMSGLGPAPLVSGVANTGTASLTWGVLTRAGGHDANVRDPDASGGAGSALILTVWRARAASAGTYTVTVTWNVDVDAGGVICRAVNGDNATNPQDANASLAATGLGTTISTPPTITGFSTTAANALLIFVQAAYTAAACLGGSTNIATPPAGWTKLASNYDVAGAANYSCLEVDYKSVSAAQSGITITSGNNGTAPAGYFDHWAAIATALVP